MASALRVLCVTIASSTPALHRAGRRPVSRPCPVDPRTAQLFLARKSPQPSVPRQVRRRFTKALFKRRTWLSRAACFASASERFRCPAANSISIRLGRLFQTAFRWRRACLTLSRLLYPPGSHLQSPAGLTGRWQSDIPLARLRAQEQEAADESFRGGVSTPLSAAPAATGFCSYP